MDRNLDPHRLRAVVAATAAATPDARCVSVDTPPQFSVNCTVTVMMTATGTPLSSVGENSHCRTASRADWSSNGIERSTRASVTRPFGPIVASMITTPWTRADCAIAGYTGLTCLVFCGGLMLPPTRTGAAGGGGGGGGAS